MSRDEQVAVVGMRLRLPGGIDTADAFWSLLADGADVFTRGPVTGAFVPLTCHIQDAHWFAADRFGISGHEAALTDPQHRLLLELAWECLETAGGSRDSVTGVFSTCSPSAFLEEIMLGRPDLWARSHSQLLEGSQGDYLATRIAYRLGLTGPALHVGSGCSSSLVALNQAIHSLGAFQCDRAIVAAASIHPPSSTGYQVREGGIYSTDGYCRPYTEQANGTVPGNGAVVLLLKRLEDAVEDGDPVLAVVLGSALNNDGARKVGFAAPSVEGQVECLTTALEVAEVDPAEVSYVEGHGTGTGVGDPIELRALAKAYGSALPGTVRHLGSVKANLGHCDVAAGLVGFVKAMLVLQRRVVPAQPHGGTPTTRHDWSDGALRLAVTTEDLAPTGPLTVAVSSLGVGGTNAHVLLRDARGVLGEHEAVSRPVRPLVRITGRTPFPTPTTPTPIPAPEPAVPVAGPVAKEALLALFARHAAEPPHSADDDFFELGGDSLGLLYLLDELAELSGVRVPVEEFSTTPTVAFLRRRLTDAALDGTTSDDTTSGVDTDVTGEVAARLAAVPPAPRSAAGTGDDVLLTGATGFVGAFVLAELLATGRRVVCLLRGADRRAELIAHLTALELWREADADRLEVVTGDLAAPRLGLDPAPHTALAARVSWVVHAAAWVNHLYPYERLAPANAHSLAAVLEFAAAERPSAVSYLSTTAVFGSAAYPPGAEVGAGPLAALPPERDGYGRSKAVGETYAACAAELGLATTVIRLPNVFGDRTRFQVNRADAVWSWITAMLRTGAYPAGFDIAGDEMFQALPADVAARAVVHTARPGPGPGVRFVNAVPNLVCSSRGLVAGLRAAGHDLMPVPDTDWYRRVAELDPREVWVAALAGDLAERPAPGPNRLHRFRLDDDPAVAELVNAHAVWTPGDLARYVATLDAR